MAVRTGAAAKKNALSKVGSRLPAGYCLRFVRGVFNVGSRYPSAISAWNNAKRRHTGKPPIGIVVPVFFLSRSPYRHVAVTTGDGRVVTTNGTRVMVYSSIDALARAWGAPFIGWTEDLNGVTVYTPPKKPSRKYTDVKALQKAVNAAPDNVWGTDSTKRHNAIRSYAIHGTTPYGVKYLQGVLKVKQDGHIGPITKREHEEAVKDIQRAVGVTVDGDYGPKTDAAVKAKIKGAKKG
jgi:hypothetical protein